MAIATELAINNAATATDMANAIFGQGVTIVSATYQGDANAKGIYSGAQTTMPGVVPGDSGVILSTGNTSFFTNGSGTTNTNTVANAGSNNNGVDGDAQLNAIAGQATFDAHQPECERCLRCLGQRHLCSRDNHDGRCRGY
jgi:hypothetical protein